MNTVTTQAVAAINTDRQNAVIAKAKLHINNITSYQAGIKNCEDSIKAYQASASKLASSVLTYKDVTGKELPTAPNANEATIIEAIKKSNDDNQKYVTDQSKGYLQGVTQQQAAIKAYNESIAKEQEALAKLSVDVVTVAGVAGAAA